MSFGFIEAFAIFQKFINDILQKYLNVFCIAYLNDILIYNRTQKKHLSHVRKMLESLRQASLYAKCHGQRCPRCSAPLPILSEKENTLVLYFRTRSLGSCIKHAYYYKVQS
jgi:uncharacterized protein with PIN domain